LAWYLQRGVNDRIVVDGDRAGVRHGNWTAEPTCRDQVPVAAYPGHASSAGLSNGLVWLPRSLLFWPSAGAAPSGRRYSPPILIGLIICPCFGPLSCGSQVSRWLPTVESASPMV